jgi:hypothetical protein
MHKRQITHTWAVRCDPRLKVYIERLAAQEVLRSADVVRMILVEGLERRGVLKRSDLAADRTEASA